MKLTFSFASGQAEISVSFNSSHFLQFGIRIPVLKRYYSTWCSYGGVSIILYLKAMFLRGFITSVQGFNAEVKALLFLEKMG